MGRLAERQHGVVARSQLLESGMGRRAVGHRVEQGRLLVIYPGVYAVGHRALSRKGRWMAAALAGGPGAALRRRSAAALWGIRPWDSPETELTVWPCRQDRPGLRFYRCALPSDELTRKEGIPVTTPARTLLDLAGALNRSQLERAINEAEIRRLDGKLSLHDLVDRHPGARGIAKLRGILDDGHGGERITRSELETEFLSFLDSYRFPRPRVNVGVEAGTRRYEADCAYTAEKLILELDGYANHDTRRSFEEDRARDRALVLAGWRVVRITWRQLTQDPGTLATDLATLLLTPGGRRPVPGLRTAPRLRHR
ncbi:MAG: type IV toxin-antitoxin system AbiEi family antitoxin domain-containing protein [Solirubrobacteraceae bacterium]